MCDIGVRCAAHTRGQCQAASAAYWETHGPDATALDPCSSAVDQMRSGGDDGYRTAGPLVRQRSRFVPDPPHRLAALTRDRGAVPEGVAAAARSRRNAAFAPLFEAQAEVSRAHLAGDLVALAEAQDRLAGAHAKYQSSWERAADVLAA